MNLKHILAACCLAALPVAAAAELAVAVVGTDGTATQHRIADVARIDIAADGITVQRADGTSASHAYGTFDRIDIGAEWSAISPILTEGSFAVWPTRTNCLVNAGGIAPESIVTVYNTAGAQVASARANADGLATADISAAPAGVYIVAAEGKSVKIVKY